MIPKLWQWKRVTAVGNEEVIEMANLHRRADSDYADTKPITTVKEAEEFFLTTEQGHVSYYDESRKKIENE